MKVQHILGAAPLYTNTFLLVTDQKHGILIDAAAEPDTYKKALAEQGATLTHILLTHGHYDHVGAVAALRRETGCKVYLDPADALGDALYPLKASDVDEAWPASGSLTIDELTFTIYHTPGHTRGSVVLALGKLLFCGDTLFAGSCGRTDMPGGSGIQMQQSLSMLAESDLRNDMQVLPGHGEDSTLGRERLSNPFMTDGMNSMF
ncbi:MAG: MBL fold metallo-hydrolase [Gemmiger sp.]|uniref:MBL fold metallo-hydrolase n=1 Tax=uncultured Gemmiger sp. TaxID=1623490 RepID=UPI0025F479ED|nr:MBL fold metallo-hydrolase [uncultured Gemmiger sp.]MDY6007803.1 MBL fold metallo-hydrolase [Gemmiger sp.]